ncbi:hypothetical protein [Chryseobacterium carnipullorum]|nr:hypothetical protein [Chryseobacterium carnipullorum]
MSAITLQSCRTTDEISSQTTDDLQGLEDLKKKTDSTSANLVPDPPVKDGQDWRH